MQGGGRDSGGFYAWKGRSPSDRAVADAALAARIASIHADTNGIYGAPRIHLELREEHDVRIGKKRGFLFLAAVQDVYSRRIIGWSMRDDLHTDLVLDALGMAVTSRGSRARSRFGWPAANPRFPAAGR